MKALVSREYGRSEVLKLEDVPIPEPKKDQVLIRVKAVSLNSSDWEFLSGSPIYIRMWGWKRPRINILGSDVAGIVEKIGENVTQFKPGDEVFGDIMYHWGGFAEYACAPEKFIIKKPTQISFEMASAFPQAGVVALQGLRTKGKLRKGEKILINGAGGGAGTFAIQIAKMMGAQITAIDKKEKLEMMKELGADDVLDYLTEDFLLKKKKYDFILDFTAHRSLSDYNKVLNPGGRYVMVGGKMNRILKTVFWGPFLSLFLGKKFGMLTHKQNQKDLEELLKLYDSGLIQPQVEQVYSFENIPAAVEKIGSGGALGKLVATLS